MTYRKVLPALVAVLGACAAAVADPPFVSMSFDAALQQAGSSGRAVFIDFYTTWCGPCKMLDQITWKDAGVQAWLQQRTVPLKLDAERYVSLAQRFKVNAYPTMIFVDHDGTVINQLVGYRDAARFLKDAEAALTKWSPKATPSSLDVARQAFQMRPGSMVARFAYGRALAEEGHRVDALKHFEACWVDGRGEAEFAPIRRSLLLTDIAAMGKRYSTAAARLSKWHDALKKSVRAGSADAEEAMDWASLSVAKRRPPTERLRIVDAMPVDTPAQQDTRQAVNLFLIDDLFATKRMEDYAAMRPMDQMLGDLRAPKLPDEAPGRERLAADLGALAAERGIRDWAVCLEVGNHASARRVRAALLKLDLTDELWKTWKRTAGKLRNRRVDGAPGEVEMGAWRRESTG